MQSVNTKSVVEYLHFLLSEINRIKLDWEISEDEVELFNNELVRFKKFVTESENLSSDIIGMVNKLELIKGKNSGLFKFKFQYNIQRDSARNQSNDLKLKQNFELLEDDIKRILNQIKYLSR